MFQHSEIENVKKDVESVKKEIENLKNELSFFEYVKKLINWLVPILLAVGLFVAGVYLK